MHAVISVILSNAGNELSALLNIAEITLAGFPGGVHLWAELKDLRTLGGVAILKK